MAVLAAIEQGAEGDRRLDAVAREDVRPRDTAVGEEPVPVGLPGLDLGGVCGRFDVKTLPASLSYQRKAGMLWLLPCRMPAWLAPVCDDRSHSQPVMRCDPSRTQRARVGACPLAIAWRTTGSASPSIWRNRMPGTSVGVGGSRRFTIRRTVWRCHTASSSTDNQVLSSDPDDGHEERGDDRLPHRSMVRPSRISLASHRISPFATRPSRPAVHRMTREKNLRDDRPQHRIEDREEHGGDQRRARSHA